MLGKLSKAKAGDMDASEDSDDDEDYAENAGEYVLYDSPLEKIDELVTVKNTLESIHAADPGVYEILVSNLDQAKKDRLVFVLSQADDLKAREEACRIAYD